MKLELTDNEILSLKVVIGQELTGLEHRLFKSKLYGDEAYYITLLNNRIENLKSIKNKLDFGFNNL